MRTSVTSHFKTYYTRCWRCGAGINEDSIFAVYLWPEYGRLNHDIVMAKTLGDSSVALHMSGDRKCVKEVSGFHGKILKRLDLPMSCDTAFLDTL